MKAHVRYDPITDECELRLWDVAGRVRMVAESIDERARLVWAHSKENEEVAPLLRVKPEVLEAIVRAASDVVPASDATVAHLKDAVGVRDRLLTLVEKAMP